MIWKIAYTKAVAIAKVKNEKIGELGYNFQQHRHTLQEVLGHLSYLLFLLVLLCLCRI
ncbi:MAG: hypothetical protein WBG70_10720 [Spirulinaceae cyanobacterium]